MFKREKQKCSERQTQATRESERDGARKIKVGVSGLFVLFV